MSLMAKPKHSAEAPDRIGVAVRAIRGFLAAPGSARAQGEVDAAVSGCTPGEYEAAWSVVQQAEAVAAAPPAARAVTGTAGRRPAVMAVLVALIAAGLGTYAAAASYDTVSHLAALKGVALPRLNPIGIDGGLAGVIVLDIAATWLAEPIWWLRMTARVFAVATVAANAAAGWPDPVGTGLRVAAPVLFVVITEAGRTLLLRGRKAQERKAKAARREQRRGDRIPAVRWLLDFPGTWALWKRMRLWRESSYRAAVSTELERLAAIEKLAAAYAPEAWQEKAPADLVWMLTSGVRMAEALARAAELTAAGERDRALSAALEAERAARGKAEAERDEAERKAESLARKLAGSGTRKRSGTSVRNGKRGPGGTGTQEPEPVTAAASGTGEAEDAPDLDTEAKILDLIAKGYSASKAGVLAGKSDSYGRQVARLAKTAPQDIVDGKS